MSRSRIRLTVLVAALAIAAGRSAAAQGSVVTADNSPPPSARELEALIRARRDSARLRFTPADARFMTGMIGHHAQAILIAGWAATHEASGTVRVLAERIINAQQDEIATMQGWLRDRGQPVPEVHGGGQHVMMPGMDMAHDGPMQMPGMLSAEQLAQLDAARGTEFDRLFLTFMIQHHRGATRMVKQLFDTDGAGQDEVVFKFASDVNVDQTTEIARMQRMLFAMKLQQSSKSR